MSETLENIKPNVAAEATADMLTRLLGQQLELTACCDEQITALLLHLGSRDVAGTQRTGGAGDDPTTVGTTPASSISGDPTATETAQVAGTAPGDAAPATSTPEVTAGALAAEGTPSAASAAGARPRISLPATGTPVPRRHSSASLMEFVSLKRKFEGYSLVPHIRELPAPPEKKAALLAVLEDDWSGVVEFGLPLPTAASLDEVAAAMHQYLRRQRNVIIDRRDFASQLQQPGETIDEYVCALKEIVVL